MADTQAQRTQGKLVVDAQFNSQQAQTTSRLTSTSINSHLHEAQPITPPQSIGILGSYRCTIDYNHHPFSIPLIPRSYKLPLHQKHLNLTTPSKPRNSNTLEKLNAPRLGSRASIRITNHIHTPFPILKLAHKDSVSIKLIQHEFAILVELTKYRLPAVKLDKQPILDNGVLCGYRMERLSKVEMEEMSERAGDVKEALGRFHCKGFSCGNLGPSNVMSKDGGINFIDLSCAGRVWGVVPGFFPGWVYAEGRFGAGVDLERFGRYWEPGNNKV